MYKGRATANLPVDGFRALSWITVHSLSYARVAKSMEYTIYRAHTYYIVFEQVYSALIGKENFYFRYRLIYCLGIPIFLCILKLDYSFCVNKI